MAGYKLTITSRRPLDPTALYPRGADIMGAFAKVAQLETQRDIWNYSMFVYAGVRPKPSFSKSERAWVGTASMGDLSITLSNGATNKRGTFYVPFVHHAGRPKADKLVAKVQVYLRDKLGPKMARAMTYDMLKARAVLTTTTVGG
jgi:hypothetical protein